MKINKKQSHTIQNLNKLQPIHSENIPDTSFIYQQVTEGNIRQKISGVQLNQNNIGGTYK